MDYTKYVGIPFLDKGRDIGGIDCWGLVRLFYKQELDIDLPSLDTKYNPDSRDTIQELISLEKEGWEPVDTPIVGCVIVFKVLGIASHVGIYLGNDKFIHAVEGSHVVIQRLDSSLWKNRIEGFYKYKEKGIASMQAVPHPLRTERFTLPVRAGTTVADIKKHVIATFNIKDSEKSSINIIINGIVIPIDKHEDIVVKDGDIIEYRTVAGKSALRLVLIIVIAYFAFQFLGPAMMQGLGSTLGQAVAVQASMMIGTLLVNAIMPIRPPELPGDPGTAKNQLLMQGSTNQANRYGAIPVVLGKVRMSALLGAQNYVESSDETSYLNMYLVWGFGPLSVSDYCIGATSIDQYENGIGKPVQYITLNDGFLLDSASELEQFNRIYGKQVKQNYHGIKLVNNATDGNPWIESTLNEANLNRLAVSIHFPQGLRHLIAKGKQAGTINAKEVQLEVQYRAIDDSGTPTGTWTDSGYVKYDSSKVLAATGVYTYVTPKRFGVSTTTSLKFYRWTRVGITKSGIKFTKVGCYTQDPYQEPNSSTVALLNKGSYGYNSTNAARFPSLSEDELSIIDICTYGNQVYTTSIGARDPKWTYANYTPSTPIYSAAYFSPFIAGYGTQPSSTTSYLTYNVLYDLGSGVVVSKNAAYISLGLTKYVQRKDAFTHTETISVPAGRYQIRVRRLTNDNGEPDDTNRYMFDTFLQTVTGYSSDNATVDIPKGNITRTALKIKATDQLNGQIEGINALVQTICWAWDKSTQTWVWATTNNPADLFRYVLQHPANAYRIEDADIANKIDMPAIEDWAEFCLDNGFQFNSVVSQQRSVTDILRDICAAGRASPNMVDGKWTVVIDRPRTDIVQHFTPHNSWGFESTKSLPRRPDGLKVTFNNQDRGYQEEELIVYDTGKNELNSAVFEQISLPGITSSDLVGIHARWHLAQARLRPEIYTLNTDLEYLVCNRGDRVKVMHDVPMWGLGSGRIKNRLSSTQLELDEPVTLVTIKTYTIRVRSKTGASITRTLAPVPIDGDYTTINITTSATSSEIDSFDLFMVGEIGAEANDLVVLSIEPFGQTNAKITLTDYSPQIYDINYLTSNFTIPDFNTKITAPPTILMQSTDLKPIISTIVSNESVMTKTSSNSFNYAIKISFNNPNNLPSLVTSVEAQLDLAVDTADIWQTSEIVDITKKSVYFTDVQEGDTYKLRLRYVGSDGRTGPWTSIVNHTVEGKTNPPAQVTGLTSLVNSATGKTTISWIANPEIDVVGYEVRTANALWGELTGFTYSGTNTSIDVNTPAAGTSTLYYIKAFDFAGNYSITASTIAAGISAPTAPRNLSYTYYTNTNNATDVSIKWLAPLTSALSISYYEVTLAKPGVALTNNVNSLEYVTNVDWTGTTTITVVAVDILGNRSASATLSMPKVAPGTPGTSTNTIVGTSIVLDWTDSATGSLPIAGYEIRSTDSGWGTAGYLQRTTGSVATLSSFNTGTNTVYIKAYDTAGQYSTLAQSVTFTINIPNAITAISIAYSAVDSQANISWNAPSVSSFAISGYSVTLTKQPGSITSTTFVNSTSLAIPVDWTASVSIDIRTVDSTGRLSNVYTQGFSKTAPSSPGTFTAVAVVSGGVQINWPTASPGTLGVAGYELRTTNTGAGTAGFIYRGAANNTILPSIAIGTNTWYLWAYDTAGQYSTTPLTVTFTTTNPQPATGLSSSFNTASLTSASVLFKWAKPLSSMFSIDRYEVSFTYTNPSSTTITSSRYTTDWEIPANWVGNGTLSVTAYDSIGGSSTVATLVVTKNLPNTPGVATTTVSGTDLIIDWPDTVATTLPVVQYEIRTVDANWGTSGFSWKGSSSSASVAVSASVGTKTWFIKAIDSDGKYSSAARSVTFNVVAPANPSVYPAEFSDTSLTNASVALYWDPVVPTFGLRGYEVTYGVDVEVVNATTITLPADWLGDKTFTIKTIDNLGNKSSGISIVATKLAPNPVSNFRAQIIDNNALLYWDLPTKTTLPISHVLLKKGDTWATSTLIGEKSGSFTAISELSGGVYTYWIATVDTDAVESTPVQLQATISQPPDFIFNEEYDSLLNSTLVNGAKEVVGGKAILLPINSTETIAQHFTNNGWDQPTDQITAGFPYYIQPGTASGYYEEVFDYGTILGSSQITVSTLGDNISGIAQISCTISVSNNGSTYTDYPGGFSVFASNFRYIKVRITVTRQAVGDIYRLNSMRVRLDAKQKTDSNSLICSSSDTNGTIVNFAREFIDIASITLSPQGTSALSAVYDFNDLVINGTYSVVSNVATVVSTAHNLKVGQNVRLFPTSGGGLSGVYTVASVIDANTYTVPMTVANTSGNISAYANSMRVYVFNNSGSRVSSTVSWTVRGY